MSQEREIQVTVKNCEDQIALGEALNRLFKNKDFRLVVTEGYFKHNAQRLVHSLSEPAISHSAEMKARVVSEMEAIGCVRGYFDQIDRNSGIAASQLEQHKRELELIRGEVTEESGDE